MTEALNAFAAGMGFLTVQVLRSNAPSAMLPKEKTES